MHVVSISGNAVLLVLARIWRPETESLVQTVEYETLLRVEGLSVMQFKIPRHVFHCVFECYRGRTGISHGWDRVLIVASAIAAWCLHR